MTIEKWGTIPVQVYIIHTFTPFTVTAWNVPKEGREWLFVRWIKKNIKKKKHKNIGSQFCWNVVNTMSRVYSVDEPRKQSPEKMEGCYTESFGSFKYRRLGTLGGNGKS